MDNTKCMMYDGSNCTDGIGSVAAELPAALSWLAFWFPETVPCANAVRMPTASGNLSNMT